MRQVKRLVRPGRPRGRHRLPPRVWVLRLRRAGAVTIVLVALGAGSLALARSSFAHRWTADITHALVAASVDAGFAVDRVYSEGRTLADEATLTRALEPYHGEPIFTVELDRIKGQLEELHWVRTASVGRRLPDTIWVRLEEHRPIARWMDGTRQVLVSDTQEIFRVRNAAQFKELPLLFGRGAPARSLEVLRLVASEPDLARHVTGARLIGARRWDVYLDSRIEVRLPANWPEAAWRRLAAEERTSALVSRAVTSIDLRNPDWLTLELPDAAFRPGKEPRA